MRDRKDWNAMNADIQGKKRNKGRKKYKIKNWSKVEEAKKRVKIKDRKITIERENRNGKLTTERENRHGKF